MDLGAFLGIAGLLLLLAALLPFIGGARRKATLDLVQRELEIERDARLEQEKRCEKEIARLSGRLDLVTRDFAQVISLEVVKVMRDEGVIP